MPEIDDLNKIAQAEEKWEKEYRLKGSPTIKTDLDIEVKPIYTPVDIHSIDYLRDIGFPGEYPFTRGPYPEMSRHKPWRYSVFTGFDTPEDTNKRWKFLYKAGQPSFSIVYDLPSHMGLDSDDPQAEDDVGRVGIPICTAKDIEILFEDLPIGRVPFYSNMETLAPLIVAMYIAAAENRGISQKELAGSISNDPLSTAVSKSTTVFPLRPSLRLATDLIEYAVRYLPKFYPLNIKGVNMSEGGANMAQEVGFSFSNALCFLNEALERGLAVDDIAPKFTFFFSTTPHIFEEVAKYRAARRLWAKLLRNHYNAQNPASMALKFTALACPLWLQFEEPELNLVRAALAGLAQALGGAQATPHPGFDEVFAIPDEKSQSLALGTQQILAEETNITKTVDPLGGSYYIEWLTNQMEDKIVNILQEVNSQGGAIAAIESGYMKRQILDYYHQVEREIANGQRVIVRRNKYRVEEKMDPRERLILHKPNIEAIRRHIERLRSLKASRNQEQVNACLVRIKDAAKEKSNLMPYLIDAAKAYVSIGEMTKALKEVFGEFRAPALI
jgi:methylmalonyl-CoA mutase N-terminal domain/subunit